MDSMTLEQAIAYVRGTHTYPASEEDAKDAISIVISAAEKWDRHIRAKSIQQDIYKRGEWGHTQEESFAIQEAIDDEINDLSTYRKAQEDKE